MKIWTRRLLKYTLVPLAIFDVFFFITPFGKNICDFFEVQQRKLNLLKTEEESNINGIEIKILQKLLSGFRFFKNISELCSTIAFSISATIIAAHVLLDMIDNIAETNIITENSDYSDSFSSSVNSRSNTPVPQSRNLQKSQIHTK